MSAIGVVTGMPNLECLCKAKSDCIEIKSQKNQM